MEVKNILESIWEYLPNEVRNNYSVSELKRKFYELLTDDMDYYFEINESIYDKVGTLKDNENVVKSVSNDLVYFEVRPLCELSFSIREDEGYNVILESSQRYGDNFKDVIVEVVVGEETTTWEIIDSLSSIGGYYLSYNIDFHTFNKNHEEINIPNLEDAKDSVFMNFFCIDKDRVRECRLNFNDNIDYINSCRANGKMNMIDRSYTEDGVMFISPFNMNDFQEIVMFGSVDDNLEEDEEEDESLNDEESMFLDEMDRRADYLEQVISSYTGYDGNFVMSFNLYLNFRSYIYQETSMLSTQGMIVRKLNGGFTLYNIYLTHESVLVIPSDISLEAAQELYNSDFSNSSINNVPEFFEIGYNKKL